MTNYSNGVLRKRRFVQGGWAWAGLAIFFAMVVIAPLVSLVWIAATPTTPIWQHLWDTALPRYVGNTVGLMVIAGIGTGFLGTALAYLVTHLQFAGRRWLEFALFAPLAMPAYIAAFAIVEFFEFAGPLQTVLRDLFGWSRPDDYFFPEIRSFGGAATVFILTLYPYVYLFARSSFRAQAAQMQDTARSLGLTRRAAFWRVSLPLARPGITAGIAIVMMETVADFGTVDFFAVQTLTTGIFSIWLESYNAGGAAQLALCLLVFVAVIVVLERHQRAAMRYSATARQTKSVQLKTVNGLPGYVLALLCLAVIGVGFLFPVSLLLLHAAQIGFDLVPGGGAALLNSAVLGGVTALLCTLAGFVLAYGTKAKPGRLMNILTRLSSLGYAVPGAVLGIALLVPLAALDHAVADAIVAMTGFDPGLLLTGGIFVLVVAYAVRFMAISIGAAESGFDALSPSIPQVARTLGLRQGQVLMRVTTPLLRTSLLTAGVLVFVDTVKELPATLLLRPFGFETLATFSYAQASLENLSAAAVPALLIVLLSASAAMILARTNR